MDALRKISNLINPKLVATHEGVKAAHQLAADALSAYFRDHPIEKGAS